VAQANGAAQADGDTAPDEATVQNREIP
jgi:hypothetical protein